MGPETASTEDRALRALRQALNFAGLSEETLRWVVRQSEARRVPAGATIFEKGTAADGLYVVVSGSVRIQDSVRGRDVDIARIEPGDFFGEVSLALHTPRTRSARADADAEVLVIPEEAVARLARDHPHFEAGLVQAFTDRMAAREAAAD